MLLTGPFGGLTDDVREFLLCLADEGLPLTGWASWTRPACGLRGGCPAAATGGDGPGGLAGRPAPAPGPGPWAPPAPLGVAEQPTPGSWSPSPAPPPGPTAATDRRRAGWAGECRTRW